MVDWFPLIPLPIKEAIKSGAMKAAIVLTFPLIPLPIKEAISLYLHLPPRSSLP